MRSHIHKAALNDINEVSTASELARSTAESCSIWRSSGHLRTSIPRHLHEEPEGFPGRDYMEGLSCNHGPV